MSRQVLMSKRIAEAQKRKEKHFDNFFKKVLARRVKKIGGYIQSFECCHPMYKPKTKLRPVSWEEFLSASKAMFPQNIMKICNQEVIKFERGELEALIASDTNKLVNQNECCCFKKPFLIRQSAFPKPEPVADTTTEE